VDIIENGGRLGLAQRITKGFMERTLDLSLRRVAPSPGWEGLPEVAVAARLRAIGKSDVDVRLFITFTAAMDRARDADRLWHGSCNMFLAKPWVFQPEEVSARSTSDLGYVLRSYGVSQRHSRDVAGWYTIATSLASPATAPAVRGAVFGGTGDARELLLARHAKGQDLKPLFPFIRGPKIGPMWIRMLVYPGGAEIKSLEYLSVAVDVQVKKVTEYLGVTETHGQPLERVRRLIQEVWAEDVRRHGAEGPGPLSNTAGALDPAIWFFGKWGCTWCERANRKIPISELCRECRFETLRAAEA
jgi:hypothetical protein